MKLKKKKESKFRPEEVLNYLDQKGWHYRETEDGNNYKITHCVFCGNDKGNFEVQKDRGYYKTWCCGEAGSFYELRKSQGDLSVDVKLGTPAAQEGRKTKMKDTTVKEADLDELTENAMLFHNKIFIRQEALQYMKSRGFNEESLRYFKIGCQKKNGKLSLTIPHWDGEKVANIKYRALSGQEPKWRQEEGAKKVLYNQNVIGQDKELILTEGELKAVALHQMGFKNVASLTGGVQTFKPEWTDLLDKVDKIYLVMDSDGPGQKGAEDLAMRIGPEKCWNIFLEDAKDIDEWFFDRKHTADEFKTLLSKAKRFDIENIVSVGDAVKSLYDEMVTTDIDKIQGLQTPWEPVNKLIKGFMPGDLIILSAPPKIGKTTWALQTSMHIAKQNNPVLFFCMEMSSKKLAKKMIQNVANMRDEDIEPEDLVRLRYEAFRRMPIFMPSHVRRGLEPEEVLNAIQLSCRRYGIKFVVFDNLHFLVRSVDKLRESIGQVSQQFKLLAEELRIPVMLIVHPRKLNKNRAMTADDFKESSSIHADADQIIMLHRQRRLVEKIESEDEDDDDNDRALLDPETNVIVDASRSTEGGKVSLWYEGALSKFVTMDQKPQ